MGRQLDLFHDQEDIDRMRFLKRYISYLEQSNFASSEFTSTKQKIKDNKQELKQLRDKIK